MGAKARNRESAVVSINQSKYAEIFYFSHFHTFSSSLFCANCGCDSMRSSNAGFSESAKFAGNLVSLRLQRVSQDAPSTRVARVGLLRGFGAGADSFRDEEFGRQQRNAYCCRRGIGI